MVSIKKEYVMRKLLFIALLVIAVSLFTNSVYAQTEVKVTQTQCHVYSGHSAVQFEGC